MPYLNVKNDLIKITEITNIKFSSLIKIFFFLKNKKLITKN